MENKTSLITDVIWGCLTTYSEGYSVKPHSHATFYHLIHMNKGGCDITLCGKEYSLHPQMIMLAAPGDEHSNSGFKDRDTEFCEIKFIVRSGQLQKALENKKGVFRSNEILSELCNQIVDLGYQRRGNEGINVIRSYMSALLYQICGDSLFAVDEANQSSPILRGIDTSGFSKATLATVAYLEKNYSHYISLELIGKEIGYYKNYISTTVKKDLSYTVGELLTQIRMHKAAELLFYSDYSIKQISEQTGYKNVQHFTRTFRRVVGIPPAHYRRSFPEEALDAPEIPDTAIPMIAF